MNHANPQPAYINFQNRLEHHVLGEALRAGQPHRCSSAPGRVDAVNQVTAPGIARKLRRICAASNPSGDSAKTTPFVFGGERSLDERIYRLPSAMWIVRRKKLFDGLAVLVTWHEL